MWRLPCILVGIAAPLQPLQRWPSGFPTAFLHPLPDHSEHFYFLPKLVEFTTSQRWQGISVVWLSCIQGYQLSLSKDPGPGMFHVPTEQVVLHFCLWPTFHYITTAFSWDAPYIAETWLPELYHSWSLWLFFLKMAGEMSHHDVLDAVANGISVILCEHSNTERGFLSELRDALAIHLQNKINIIVAEKDRDPLQVA